MLHVVERERILWQNIFVGHCSLILQRGTLTKGFCVVCAPGHTAADVARRCQTLLRLHPSEHAVQCRAVVCAAVVCSGGSRVLCTGSRILGLLQGGSGIQGPGSRDAVGGGDDFWPGFHPHMRHCHPKGKELHEVTFLAHPQNKIHTKSWTRTMYLQFHCPYSKKNCMHNASFALRFITYCTSQKQNPAFPEQVKCNRCVF